MKKSELIKLKKLLQQETDRRNRINELLSNNLIQEFLKLNNLDIQKLSSEDKWLILDKLLKEFTFIYTNLKISRQSSYEFTSFSENTEFDILSCL